ncbi:MAG: hypothetical protein M3137_10690 [Actinomycetota bacterium]|nr:hypothetical protein [Actinomycetota bacterium]
MLRGRSLVALALALAVATGCSRGDRAPVGHVRVPTSVDPRSAGSRDLRGVPLVPTAPSVASRYSSVSWDLDGISPDGMVLALRFRDALCVGSYAEVAESETAVLIVAFAPDPLPPNCDESPGLQVAGVGLAHPLAQRSLVHVL